MKTTFESLPDELLCEIFSYFSLANTLPEPRWHCPQESDCEDKESQRVLSRLCRISKRFARLARPFLYVRLEYRKPTEYKPNHVQSTSEVAHSSIDSNHNEQYLQHVRELVFDLDTCSQGLDTLLSSALFYVTRATFSLKLGTIITSVRIAAGLSNLDTLLLDDKSDPDVVKIFLAELPIRDGEYAGERRKARLRTLEIQSSEPGVFSGELVTFIKYFGVSALSFFMCSFDDYDFRSLAGTTIVKLSLDSGDFDEEVNLSGLEGMKQLDTLRIGDMYGNNPSAISGNVPQQICHLQFMYRDPANILPLFEGSSLAALANLQSLDLHTYGVEEYAQYSSFPQDLDDFSQHFSCTSTALTSLTKRGLRSVPWNVLHDLEHYANTKWGLDWRKRLEDGEEETVDLFAVDSEEDDSED